MTITCPKCKAEFPLTERALAGLRRLIDEKDRELEAARASIGEYRDKLAAAHAEQLELERARNAFAQKMSEVDLEIERRVRERLDGATSSIKDKVAQDYVLQIQDRDTKLDQLRTQVEGLQRRLAQGSQQIQGESQEINIETELRAAFPADSFTPVPKGESGADLVQTVAAHGGGVCGTILWESKRTKHWNAAWLEKLRSDQRDCGADVSVLVSQTVPAGVTSFKNVEDVWVTRRPLIVPIASVLRSALIRCAVLRATSQGRQTKAGMVYDYLTGSGFAHRIMPVIESLAHLRRDVDSKRARMERELAREEQRITGAQVSVERLIGDIQGIAGITNEELEDSGMPALVAAG